MHPIGAGGAVCGEVRDVGKDTAMVQTGSDNLDRYDGAVAVGGPAQTRVTGGLEITKVAVGAMDNNAYLLRDSATGEQLLIDAAAEPTTLLGLIGDRPLQQVLTTHRHADHWQALAEVVAATGARTLTGVDDAEGVPVPTDVPLLDSGTVAVGHQRLNVRQVVGHTPGAVVLVWEPQDGPPHLFTGDCLFPGGPGRTTSPADFTSIMDDLQAKVFDVLPDDTWVYPGHGADTTLGTERPHLAQWLARGW